MDIDKAYLRYLCAKDLTLHQMQVQRIKNNPELSDEQREILLQYHEKHRAKAESHYNLLGQ